MRVRIYDPGVAVVHNAIDGIKVITNDQPYHWHGDDLVVVMEQDMPIHIEYQNHVLTLYPGGYYMFFLTTPDTIYNVEIDSAYGDRQLGNLKVHFRRRHGYYDTFVHLMKTEIDWEKARRVLRR
jgi:hypothetical protein